MTDTDTRATDPTATRVTIVQTVMDWWDDGLFMYPDEEQAAGSLADAILAALAAADVCVVRREDVGLCFDAAMHRAQEVRDPAKRTEYFDLAERMMRLHDTALAASGEPGGGEER